MSKPFYQNKQLVRPAAIPIATVNIRNDGGGIRKGFGTLLKAESFDEVAAEKAVKNHITQTGDVDLDELKPSISKEEVQPEALKKDYDRTKSFLKSFLNTPPVLVNPFNGKEADGVVPSCSFSRKTDRREDNNDKTKKLMEKEKEMEKNKVINVKSNEVAKSKEVLEKVVAAKVKKPLKLSVSSEAGLKRKGVAVRESGTKEVMLATEPKQKAPIRSLGSIVADLNVTKEHVEISAGTGSFIGLKPGENANMDELKNIFYKGNGVGWSDTQTEVAADSQATSSNMTVLGGDAATDALFREAELMGYDIRDTVIKTEDASAPTGDSGFSFGFFEPEPEAAVELSKSDGKSAAVPPSVTKPVGAAAASSGKESEGSRRVQNTMKVHHSALDKDGQPLFYKAVPMPNTLEILKRAKRFCRERPVEAIIEEWKEGREKMVLDYKKKRKDALRNIKKRKAQYQYKK